MRFQCRLTCCILWPRMCENETVMPLLAIFPSSMHFLLWGCWRVAEVRAVVHDIWEVVHGGGGVSMCREGAGREAKKC